MAPRNRREELDTGLTGSTETRVQGWGPNLKSLIIDRSSIDGITGDIFHDLTQFLMKLVKGDGLIYEGDTLHTGGREERKEGSFASFASVPTVLPVRLRLRARVCERRKGGRLAGARGWRGQIGGNAIVKTRIRVTYLKTEWVPKSQAAIPLLNG